jgi:predicted transglutaminase-like cysteine proteinase
MGVGTIFRTMLTSSLMGLALMAGAAAGDGTEPHASYATLGGETSVPYGWLDFCSREPQECNQPVLQAVDVNLTSETWQILDKINKQVNRTIVPLSNLAHWGTILDHWDYPADGKGDCKIYALQKRRLLMQAGLPRQALLMTIVRDLDGEGHAILTVKTNKGEFTLDNLTDDIRPWDATGYHFLKRQSQADPNVWVAVVQSKAIVSSLQ